MNTLNARLVPSSVQDLVLLLSRVGLGVVLVAHGWQKVSTNGVGATADGFASMGIPSPEVAAYFQAYLELVGGGLLVLGLLTPLVGLLVAGSMAGAFWFAHRGLEVLAAEGGWELVALIGLLALVVAAVGPGRISVDHVLASRRTRTEPAGPVGSDERDRVGA